MKLRGSTLVETIVAMVIISFVIGLASVTYLNILRSQSNMRKLKTHDILEQIANETKEKKIYIDEEIKVDNFKIKKHYEKFTDTNELFLMELQAVDEAGKIIDTRKELVLNPANE